MMSASRKVVWRLFCPRCLTPHERHAHEGTPETTRRIRCAGCGKNYEVTSRIDGQGRPRCQATPVFVRGPEVLSDSDPTPTPR